jgi:hypothetical protein
MGLTLCKLHGRSEIVFACPHIQELIDARLKMKDFVELKVDVADVGVAVPYNFCPACSENYKLPLTTEVLSDTASDDYDAALDITQPVCENCLADAKKH